MINNYDPLKYIIEVEVNITKYKFITIENTKFYY